MYMFNMTAWPVFCAVTPTRVCSLVVEGDLAPPTEGSHDPHVTKQEEEEEEEDEGLCIRVNLFPFYVATIRSSYTLLR